VSKWNVTPNQLGGVLALAGDSADNIPGVHGIGPKIVASLISEYGTLDQLLKQVETVKQKCRRTKLIDYMDKLSRQLVDLERAIPMDNMTFPGSLTSAAELRMAPLNGD
jgi:DNA polymerase-1